MFQNLLECQSIWHSKFDIERTPEINIVVQ